MIRAEVLAIVALFLLSSPAFGQPGADEDILLHNFGAGRIVPGTTLQSASLLPLSLKGRTETLLRERGLHPRIMARQANPTLLNLTGTRIQSVDLNFTLDGFPLCQYQVKSHETVDGKMAVFGKMPAVDVGATYSLTDWPSEGQVRNIVADALSQNGVSGSFSRISSRPCLWSESGQLHPVWVWEVESEGLNYSVVADDLRSFKFQPKHFHATGKAKIYPYNSLDSELQEFTLRDMKEGGGLENSYFITVMDSPFTRVSSTNLDFTAFGPTTEEFKEISLFTNANRTLEWLESMGYKNFGTIPIRIAVHAVFQDGINNALYQPGTSYDVIFVGDGDGVILQNLAIDADVVGHELAHHVVYHTVTEISGESLVLHEGLADFFNFARTGNACLGESICTDTIDGDNICYVPGHCLRTGENDLKLGGATLPRLPHQKSQFISGMLWDLHEKDGIPLEDISRMVLRAIDLLVRNSGYQHFVVGMMLADQVMFQGGKCSLILNRALERGLGSKLTDEGISCDSVKVPSVTSVVDIPGVAKTATPTTDQASPGTTSRTSSKKSICGVLSGASSANGQLFSFLLLFMLPLMPAMIRQFTRK